MLTTKKFIQFVSNNYEFWKIYLLTNILYLLYLLSTRLLVLPPAPARIQYLWHFWPRNLKSLYFTPSLPSSCLGVLQVLVGVSLIFKGRCDLGGESKLESANRINNYVVVGVFLITVINVFIAAFSTTSPVATPQPVTWSVLLLLDNQKNLLLRLIFFDVWTLHQYTYHNEGVQAATLIDKQQLSNFGWRGDLWLHVALSSWAV